MVREVAAQMLAKAGFQVELAAHGAEAVEMYIRARDGGIPFDVVLMDLSIISGMGGKETIRRLKRIDPSVCAVLSSGYSNNVVMSDFERYGFSAAIAKPWRFDDLIFAINSVLSRKSGQEHP